jgi:hypothetical protein
MGAIVFIFLCIAAAWVALGNTVMTRTATQNEALKTAVGEMVQFSYTFFFERFTALAITVLCILTLFVVMQFTGRVDWDNLFRRSPTAEADTAPRV